MPAGHVPVSWKGRGGLAQTGKAPRPGLRLGGFSVRTDCHPPHKPAGFDFCEYYLI